MHGSTNIKLHAVVLDVNNKYHYVKSCPSSVFSSKHEQVHRKLPDNKHLKFCLDYKKNI